jgi:hypothetical protein
MVLYSGRLIDWNSAAESDIQERTTSGEIRQFPRELNAPCTIAVRKRAAARAARSAVTGPCTMEYEPCTDGKRKIIRTQRTATTASSHVMRPESIDVATLYREMLTAQSEFSKAERCTKIDVSPCPSRRSP